MRGGATPDPLPRRRGGGEQGAAQRITRAEEARRRVRGARAIYRLSPVHSAGSLWDAPCHIYQRNCAIPTAIPTFRTSLCWFWGFPVRQPICSQPSVLSGGPGGITVVTSRR